MPKKRSEAQADADFLVDFGVLPGPLDHESKFGLIMNSQRAAHRRVYYQGLAFALARSAGEIPLAVISAVCDSPTEAEELAFTINADRAQSAAGY